MRPLILLTALLLSTPVVAGAAPKASDPAVSPSSHHEVAKLRRTLASALVVKAINPTAEQKKQLLAEIAVLRGVRDAAKSDKDLAALQDRRKALLTRAIGEARATGSVSAATKAEMKNLREDGKDERADVRGAAKESMQRIRAVLTPAQLEAVRDLAAGMPGRKAKAGKGDGKRGKGMLLRLMMSEELAAELSR